MNACIVYSSCTGNTRKVAEALADTSGLPCFPVRIAPEPDDFDILALGFWVRKGLPDARALRYMERIRGKHVFFFGHAGRVAPFRPRPPLHGGQRTKFYRLAAIR